MKYRNFFRWQPPRDRSLNTGARHFETVAVRSALNRSAVAGELP
jgi:hypothetical protein